MAPLFIPNFRAPVAAGGLTLTFRTEDAPLFVPQIHPSALVGGNGNVFFPDIVPLAVTTNLSINFLRKPSAERDIIGVCKLIKLGKTLAVGEVAIYSEGNDEPVAHVVGTYAIPRAVAR